MMTVNDPSTSVRAPRFEDEAGFRRPLTSLKDLVLILFRRKTVILLAVIITTGSVLLGSYLREPQYRASASFLIHRELPPSLTRTARPIYTMGRDEVIQTEVAILGSRAVVAGAVDRLGLVERAVSRHPIKAVLGAINAGLTRVGLVYQASPRDRWIDFISGEMQVKPVPQADVVTLSLDGSDRELVTEIVRALSRSYVDNHSKLYRNRAVHDFYEEQVRVAKESLEELHAQEGAAKKALSVSAVDEERTLLLAQQSELEEEIRDLTHAREQLLQAVRALRRASETGGVLPMGPLTIAESFPSLSSMQDRLVDLQNQRIEMLQRYQKEDRKVLALSAQIDDLRSTLTAAVESTATQLADRSRFLARQARDLEQGLLELNEKQKSLREISLAVGAAEKTYMQFRERLEETRLDAVSTRQAVNVSIIDEAEVPTRPLRSRLFSVVLAFGLSLFLGIGGAFLAELADSTIHTPSEAPRRLGLPVLAVFPLQAARKETLHGPGRGS
jgi:uncharacterized protein involved in exopolysaccharide biosynthesis